MSDKFFIVDMGPLKALAEIGQEGLDLLFKSSDRIIITQNIYDEILNYTGPEGDIIRQWFDNNFDETDKLNSKIVRPAYTNPPGTPGNQEEWGQVLHCRILRFLNSRSGCNEATPA